MSSPEGLSGYTSESLRWRFLSDTDALRLYESNPGLRGDPAHYCPTCLKEGTYTWKGVERVCDCELQLQLHKHYLNAGIGVVYQRLSWDDYMGSGTVRNLVGMYLSNHKKLVARGTGIMLLGAVGTGKTMALSLLLKELLWAGYTCYSTTFTSMIEMFTAGWNSREDQVLFQRQVKQSQVLLLDDVGKEMKTKARLAESTFDDVLRVRVKEGRPTFITSNMTMDELKEGYGGAIFSLLQEVSLTREVEGDDFRPLANARVLEETTQQETRPIF